MMILGMLLFGLALAEDARVRRIVGGSDADIKDYPYLVSFRSRNPGADDFFFGAGSILNEHWILTAAHCLNERNLTNVYVVAGTKYSRQPGTRYEIFFAILHHDYRTFRQNDIALARINGKIKFNDYNVQPVKLPSGINTDSNADFAGWGAVWGGPKGSGHYVNGLQKIPLTIISNDICLKSFNSITSGHLCTLNRAGQGLCVGDSGGPLVANGVQVGIGSYVRPCAEGTPDVFTRVSSYVDWIKQVQKICARLITS